METTIETASLPFLPPRPEDEADLFNMGEAGHEKIEYDALTPLVSDPRIVAAVYFGNWQRDLSQLLAPSLHSLFGNRTREVCDLILAVVDVLAEAKFGRRLDRVRFGTYRWEEHIDNPREFGVALDPRTCAPVPPQHRRPQDEPEAPRWQGVLWAEGAEGLPNYLHVARGYALRQLGLALRHGPTAAGYEHLGNALHTIEDHYAHSNFIELAFHALAGREDPMTGSDARTGQPLRDRLGRYRLTTGIFLLGDTLASLEKILLRSLEKPPGAVPSALDERIVRVLVQRMLGPQPLALYDRMLHALRQTGIPAMAQALYNRTGLPDLRSEIERLVLYPLRLQIANLLRPLAEAAARQTGTKAYPLPNGRWVREISHSQIAKDGPDHRYHAIARALALEAVRAFWREMAVLWQSGPGARDPEQAAARLRPLIVRYMNHPQAAGSWWQPILTGWTPQPTPALQTVPVPTVPTAAVLPAWPPRPAAPPPHPGRPFAVLAGFAFGRADLSPKHKAQIQGIARALAVRQTSAVQVIGHTDNSGSQAYNLALGQRRAAAVRAALIQALERLRPGLSQHVQIAAESRGEAQPIASNQAPQGQSANRRVEVAVRSTLI